MKDWEKYQIQVAQTFRRMGYRARVGRRVRGARAPHNVDVWVEFQIFGIQVRWIAECKYWKRKIPKEKVAALKNIVDDLGVDRGFMMSERGFQPAARRVASHTNVTLTSLAELEEAAREGITRATLNRLRARTVAVLDRARRQLVKVEGPGNLLWTRPPPGVDARSYMEAMGRIVFMQYEIDRALLGASSLFLPPPKRGRGRHVSVEEFLSAASRRLKAYENLVKVARN